MISLGDFGLGRKAVNARKLRRAIKRQCIRGNQRQVAALLLQWGRLVFPLSRCSNLITLSEHFRASQGARLLKELDQSLYGRGQGALLGQSNSTLWDGKGFWKTMAPCLKRPALKTVGGDSEGLPPLYFSG